MSLAAEIKQKILDCAGKVAVLFGGFSSEREVSLKSGAAVLKALQAQGVDAVGIDAGENMLEQVKAVNPDHVFIALHGPGGEDGLLQGALELAGFAYTGSGVLASALGMDKEKSKKIWQGAGTPVANAVHLTPDTDFAEALALLGGKVIIKPSHEGSSIGMSVAETSEQLQTGFELAARYDSSVMAERWIDGPEYTVAIVNGEVMPAIRLESTHEFYDYEAKYEANDTRYLCPCGLSQEDEEKLGDLALKAFETVGCEGWGRVDVMADQSGNFYVLEVNTVPGMTDHSLVPMAAKAAGYSFEDLVLLILGSAINWKA
ncbi:MAG: D-alanine--D-alanine ligase [Cellvibrionaceae bacterium]